MTARFYADIALASGASVSLPEQTARHVQVLRLQPGDRITLFNGMGDGQPGSEGEFEATVERMGRSEVQVTIGAVGANGDLHLAASHALDGGLKFAFAAGLAVAHSVEQRDAVARLQAQDLNMARGLLWQADGSAARQRDVGVKTGGHALQPGWRKSELAINVIAEFALFTWANAVFFIRKCSPRGFHCLQSGRAAPSAARVGGSALPCCGRT